MLAKESGDAKMTASNGNGHAITTMAQLEALYSEGVYPPAKFKEVDRITSAYRKLVEASPFFALATIGPDGLDCSPRGDPNGFVRVVDEKTIVVPDRRGNNRIDSLRNLISDPRVALLFLIPGVSETLRIMGRATISTDPELCASFTMQGKAPRSVLVVKVDKVFFQCAKAIVRSKLWDPATKVERSSLPTAGAILAEITEGKLGGPEHDKLAPERMRATIY
jgi:PPOX class probable FMN-dependent enzyme